MECCNGQHEYRAQQFINLVNQVELELGAIIGKPDRFSVWQNMTNQCSEIVQVSMCGPGGARAHPFLEILKDSYWMAVQPHSFGLLPPHFQGSFRILFLLEPSCRTSIRHS